MMPAECSECRRAAMLAEEAEMKCDLCEEPSKSFIGSRKKPMLIMCWDHDAKFTKANMRQRERMLKRGMMKRFK